MIKQDIELLQAELVEAAHRQDEYDLKTLNLIAPASPTRREYIDLPLRHADITEGLLGHRPYAGAAGFNTIEGIAVKAACDLFGAEHANVQPHSVSQANQAVYQGLLELGDQVLAMSFETGGHLTHGMTKNFSGRNYKFNFYGVNTEGRLDYEAIQKQAEEIKPKLIVCGASSYPRTIDFAKLGEISKSVGAYLMADLSHPAGLVATKRFPQPFPYCDVVTLTLDKTMLGPHGGILMCKEELAERLDKAVHPGVQSSIPLRRIYEMAQCLLDCNKPWFADFSDRLLKNMKVFEKVFLRYTNSMVTGGSDTHLMVVNTLQPFGLTGKDAEGRLEEVDILTNRQVVPGETQKPYVASGIRFGATWSTARGFNEEEMERIAELMVQVLEGKGKPADVKAEVARLVRVKRENDVWQGEVPA